MTDFMQQAESGDESTKCHLYWGEQSFLWFPARSHRAGAGSACSWAVGTHWSDVDKFKVVASVSENHESSQSQGLLSACAQQQ